MDNMPTDRATEITAPAKSQGKPKRRAVFIVLFNLIILCSQLLLLVYDKLFLCSKNIGTDNFT